MVTNKVNTKTLTLFTLHLVKQGCADELIGVSGDDLENLFNSYPEVRESWEKIFLDWRSELLSR